MTLLPPTRLAELVALSQRLGLPERDLVILGDGNTSARADAETFWVKASGAALHQITPAGFTQVRTAPLLELLAHPAADDGVVRQALTAAKVDPAARHPSIETVLHAVALTTGGAAFVAHTHPVAVNAVLCSRRAREALSGHLFSESALYLGAAPLILPYADPGLPLARAFAAELPRYLEAHGEPPRVIYLLNHGLVTLGQTAAEAENITAMAVKACRILLGTYALGGPHFIPEAEVRRITQRADERDRRRLANQQGDV